MAATALAGEAVLQALLQKPPAEVAEWALEQLGSLSRDDVNVEDLPIFELAGTLNRVSSEERQLLIHNAIAGFGDLPTQRRAEALRLVMNTANFFYRVEPEQQRVAVGASEGGCGPSQPGSPGSNVVDASRLEAAAPSSSSRRRANAAWLNSREEREVELKAGYSYSRASSEEPSSTAPTMVKNLLHVVKEAKLEEIPRDEVETMAQEARREGVRLVQPKQLIDVVSELAPEEREQLTEVLVEARVVPEEQRGILEEAVRPGGYADKLSASLSALATAREYHWVFAALLVAEVFFAIVLGLLPCGTALVPWLRVDSLLAVGFAGAVYYTAQTLAPAYRTLREDPVGAVQRWQTLPEDSDLHETLEAMVPGVQFDTYYSGGIGTLVCVGLVLLGALWAVIGVLQLLATLIFGCSGLTLLVCTLFIALRFGIAVSLVLLVFHMMDEVQRHRSRAVLLGGPLLPMYEEVTQREGNMPSQLISPEPERAPPSQRDDFL